MPIRTLADGSLQTYGVITAQDLLDIATFYKKYFTVDWPPADDNQLVIELTGTYQSLSLDTLAKSKGWDGVSSVNIKVVSLATTIIGSNSTSTHAFTIPVFPTGSTITLINSGYIVGHGGDGGGLRSAGGDGGPALWVQTPTTIINTGTIGGGGGGGGGANKIFGSARGGGGAGYIVGDGEYAASLTAGGGGGYNAGSGGGLGQAGGSGQCGGGAAGHAVDGNSLVTWQTKGTVLGLLA